MVRGMGMHIVGGTKGKMHKLKGWDRIKSEEGTDFPL